MNRILLITIAIASILGCSGNPKPKAPEFPDFVKGVAQVFLEGDAGQVCPIAPDKALSARHVFKELREGIPVYLPGRWSNGLKEEGWARGLYLDATRDIMALALYGNKVSIWFEREEKEPMLGDRVLLVGYNWAKEGMPPRPMEATITGFHAGHFIINRSPGSGASGSCVLSVDGKLLGIHTARFESVGPNDKFHGICVSVFGSYWPLPEEVRVDLSPGP